MFAYFSYLTLFRDNVERVSTFTNAFSSWWNNSIKIDAFAGTRPAMSSLVRSIKTVFNSVTNFIRINAFTFISAQKFRTWKLWTKQLNYQRLSRFKQVLFWKLWVMIWSYKVTQCKIYKVVFSFIIILMESLPASKLILKYWMSLNGYESNINLHLFSHTLLNFRSDHSSSVFFHHKRGSYRCSYQDCIQIEFWNHIEQHLLIFPHTIRNLHLTCQDNLILSCKQVSLRYNFHPGIWKTTLPGKFSHLQFDNFIEN